MKVCRGERDFGLGSAFETPQEFSGGFSTSSNADPYENGLQNTPKGSLTSVRKPLYIAQPGGLLFPRELIQGLILMIRGRPPLPPDPVNQPVADSRLKRTGS